MFSSSIGTAEMRSSAGMCVAFKALVRQAFNRASRSYDQGCQLQSAVASQLIDLLPLQHHYARVIDLGCGTGNSTQRLAKQIELETLYALDFSEGLLAKARAKSYQQQPQWLLADFDRLSELSLLFDLVYSNMALHWSVQPLQLIESLHQQLTPGGVLAFSIPIVGTFQELKPQHRQAFMTEAALQSALSAYDCLSFVVHHTQHQFASYHQALISIKRVGATATQSQSNSLRLRRSDFANFFQAGAPPQLSYRIALVVAKRKT